MEKTDRYFFFNYLTETSCEFVMNGLPTLFLYFFFFYSQQLYCPIVISPMGNLDCLPQGKLAAAELHHPTYSACRVFMCFHNPPNSDMDYLTFNMRADVTACDCTQECLDTVREFALKDDSGRKIPCRTGKLNLCQWCAGQMLHQQSYIPTPDTLV